MMKNLSDEELKRRLDQSKAFMPGMAAGRFLKVNTDSNNRDARCLTLDDEVNDGHYEQYAS